MSSSISNCIFCPFPRHCTDPPAAPSLELLILFSLAFPGEGKEEERETERERRHLEAAAARDAIIL